MFTMKHSSSQLIRQHHPHAKVDIYCISNQYISTITISIIILLSMNIFLLTYSLLSVESFMATIPFTCTSIMFCFHQSQHSTFNSMFMQNATQADSVIIYFIQHIHNTLSVVFPSCSVSSRISSNFQPSQKANDSDDR